LDSSLFFYSREYDREIGELKDIGITSPSFFFSNGTFPIRIGRHSGAESVTIEGHRSIRVKEGRDKYSNKSHATTLWLAAQGPRPQNTNNLQSFGWAEFHEITPPDEDNLLRTEAEWLAQRKLVLQEKGNNAIGKEPQKINNTVMVAVEPPKAEPIIWPKARITYAANKGEINASHENKNAFTKDKSILSEEMFDRLKKRKPIEANVKVELIGGKNYTLLEIL